MVLDKSLRHNRKRSKSPICVTKFGVPKNLSKLHWFVVGIHPISAQDGLEIQRRHIEHPQKRLGCSISPFDAKNGFINIAFYPFNSISWSKNNIKMTWSFSQKPMNAISRKKHSPEDPEGWTLCLPTLSFLVKKTKIPEGAMFGAPCK